MDRRRLVVLLVGLLLALGLVMSACDASEDKGTAAGTSSPAETQGPASGDIEGRVGEEIKVGNATITVRALEATFQPAMPEQRLSEQTPSAPESGESFYQAYVRIKNRGVTPLRVDAEDFACLLDDAVSSIEPTRSGPLPRSLLTNASLDLVLTFKGRAGFEPVLVYRPPWHRGVITISSRADEGSTTTTR